MRASGPIAIRGQATGARLGPALGAEETTEPRTDATPAGGLHVQLDAPLPTEVAVGAGTALFVCGTAYSALAPIGALELLVDGEPQALLAHGMPRLDTLRALHPGLDPYATREVERDPASIGRSAAHELPQRLLGLRAAGATARSALAHDRPAGTAGGRRERHRVARGARRRGAGRRRRAV